MHHTNPFNIYGYFMPKDLLQKIMFICLTFIVWRKNCKSRWFIQKNFILKMSNSARTSNQKSLSKARKHEPTSWHLLRQSQQWKHTRTMCKTSSTLTMKTSNRRRCSSDSWLWTDFIHYSSVSNAEFEQ